MAAKPASDLIDILLIEDNPGDVRLIEEMIHETELSTSPYTLTGFELQQTSSLAEGILISSQESFNLILVDLGLPDSQGLDTIIQLQKKVKDIPIIVLTGLNNPELSAKALRSGAQDYLVKGEFDSVLLTRSIRYAMERKQKELELIRLYETLQQSQAKLIQTEKLSTMGMMAAGIAHELNNPMMGILNFTQYCKKHTEQSDKRYKILSDIELETKRCIDIVQNLLTFSHMGELSKDNLTDVKLSLIVKRVVKLLSYRIRKLNVVIKKEIKDDPQLRLRENEIQDVILNLMSNAIDALEKSRIKELEIKLYKNEKYVHLCVADTGCGVPPEYREDIFNPFFTTKKVGQGTGLGLAISQGILEKHNGELHYKNRTQGGSIFTVSLPV